MLCHRKGHQKPDVALIHRFQKLCGKSFFNGNVEDKPSSSLSDESLMNCPWEGEHKSTEDSSMELDHTGSPDGGVPSNPFTLSQSLPWVPPPSDDFDLFSSRSGVDTAFHDQPIAQLSPKNSFLKEKMRPMLHRHSGNPSRAQAVSELFKQTEPTQFCNGIHSFAQAPTRISPFSHFAHRDSGYGGMNESFDSCTNAPPASQASQEGLQTVSPDALFAGQKTTSRPELDQFRFCTTLNASTAMVSAPGDVPESYLNKGNKYNLQVRDSAPPTVSTETIRYRTFIRISFDEKERRSDPAAYWKLWKESQDSRSQSHREKAISVDYPGQDNTQMQIEQVSVDGFCVVWTSHPDANVHSCNIPVQFNFLSTDFTRSKGVKGISVRLCSKTEQVSPADASREAEICFCKVKLFRDHGAERKHSNDVASIHKKIERLKQQFNEPPEPEHPAKRRRGKSDVQGARAFRYSKQALKRQDVWPPNLNNPSQMEFQDPIRSKIDALQSELASTFCESHLCLRGDITDDPDLYPIFSLDETPSDKQISFDSAKSYSASSKSDSISSDGSSPEYTANSASGMVKRRRSTGSLKRSNQDHREIPVACFFTLLSSNGPSSNQNYRAIYPTERTVHELAGKISEKYLFQPASVSRVLYISQSGLEVLVDDDFVREMAEGQAMGVGIDPIPCPKVTTSDAMYEIRLAY